LLILLRMAEFKKAAGPHAEKAWAELKKAKNMTQFASIYAEFFAVDENYDIEKIFTELIGPFADVSESKFYKMCAAFGGATADVTMLKWIKSELWDANTKNVAGFFHNIDEEEAKKTLTREHGQFLFRYGSTPGTLTLSRIKVDNKDRCLVVKGKLTCLGPGKGWSCMEKKKNFPSLKHYFKARGSDGDGRLLEPTLRGIIPEKKPATTPYAAGFDFN